MGEGSFEPVEQGCNARPYSSNVHTQSQGCAYSILVNKHRRARLLLVLIKDSRSNLVLHSRCEAKQCQLGEHINRGVIQLVERGLNTPRRHCKNTSSGSSWTWTRVLRIEGERKRMHFLNSLSVSQRMHATEMPVTPTPYVQSLGNARFQTLVLVGECFACSTLLPHPVSVTSTLV